MKADTDRKILEVLNNSTKQLATPIAIFAAGYFIKNGDIGKEYAEAGRVISLTLCFYAGWFTAKVSYVARDDLSKIGLATINLYGYYLVITLLHLVLFAVGAYAVLGK